MKSFRWAVIGAGGIADRRAIPALVNDPASEVVAVMDRTPEIAAAVAEKYGVPRHYTDPAEMLRDAECDAVYIATPVFQHRECAMLALKHRRPVLLEKPMALNAREGKALLEAFRKAGLQLSVGYMMGYHNLHVKARDLIRGGALGDVSLARMQFSCWYPDIPGAWRQEKALGGGGCIMDLAVHCMELFSAVTGEEIARCGGSYATRTFHYEVEDSAALTFRSKSGILGHIDVNFNLPDGIPSRVEFYGTRGCLVCEGTLGQQEGGRLRLYSAPQAEYDALQSRAVAKPRTWYGRGGNLYAKEFAAFEGIIRAGRTDYANAERAVHIQALCDSVYRNNEW